MDKLRQVLEKLDQVRVVILGDFLLDEFVFGEIERVSREAPVLILNYRETHRTVGGGANTTAGVAALGAQAIPVGFVGSDSWASILLSLWGPLVNRDYVFSEPGMETTRKTRILAGSFHSFKQQVVRLDHEHAYSLTADQEARITRALEVLIPATHALILSDYSLGNVTQNLRRTAIDLAHQQGIPVVADSRFDPAGFRSATSITPNISEVEAVLGTKIGREDRHLEEVGHRLLEEWDLESLLITRGKLGMSLFEKGRATHIPSYGTDEVADVTGAGDTVIATFTTALAAGASFQEAAVLANLAGSVVVGKKGTATVTRQELLEVVEEAGKEVEGWLLGN